MLGRLLARRNRQIRLCENRCEIAEVITWLLGSYFVTAPIHEACAHGDLAEVQRLHAEGAALDLEDDSNYGAQRMRRRNARGAKLTPVHQTRCACTPRAKACARRTRARLAWAWRCRPWAREC